MNNKDIELSVKELLCGQNQGEDNNYKVVIPDLQRDYCWGTQGTLVSDFVDSLFLLDKEQDITMGMVYCYYDENDNNHLQLCDGQQRLTTIFLLLGVINRMLGNNAYKSVLVSDFEYDRDDKEPFLQYAIRESSLYFLSDLVCEYFLSNSIEDINSINKAPWHFNHYNDDPTIISIKSAIRTIENKLNNSEDLKALGDFVLDKIHFLKYDMGNRKNGEETFVVINTTGEPLSATQNLKPIILEKNKDFKSNDNRSASRLWEDMDKWFWQHRNKADLGSTSDNGLREFLRLVMIIHNRENPDWVQKYLDDSEYKEKFDVENIKLGEILSLHKALVKVYDAEGVEYLFKDEARKDSPRIYNCIKDMSDCFRIIPVLFYAYKFPDVGDRDIQRVARYFLNLSRTQTINKDNKSVYWALKLIEKMPNYDILSVLDMEKIPHVITDEEISKLEIIKKCVSDRVTLENEFWRAEHNNVIWGNTKKIIDWCYRDGDFDFEIFKKYHSKIEQCWKQENLNDMRLAFLTFKSGCYPLNNGHSLGNTQDDWRLFYKNNDFLKDYLDKIDENNVKESNKKIISSFNDPNYQYYMFFRDRTLLDYCEHKLIYTLNSHYVIVRQALKKSNKFFIDAQELPQNESWERWWYYTNNCFYTDNIKYNVAVDIWWGNGSYSVQLFNRENDKESYNLDSLNLEDFQMEKKDNRYKLSYNNVKDVIELISKIFEIIK